jgi:hypothetical protein
LPSLVMRRISLNFEWSWLESTLRWIQSQLYG